MVTREDLTVLESTSEFESDCRNVVAYNGRTFILRSHQAPTELDKYEEWLRNLPGEYGLLFFINLLPQAETFVMEAKWDSLENEWVPKNECTIECANGVCIKRVATNPDVGDADLAFTMLLNHLNA